MVLNLTKQSWSINHLTSNSNSQHLFPIPSTTPFALDRKMIEFGCVAAGCHHMGSRAHHRSCDGGLFCTGKPTNCSQATTSVESKIRLFIPTIGYGHHMCNPVLQPAIKYPGIFPPGSLFDRWASASLVPQFFTHACHTLFQIYSCLISSQSGELKQVKQYNEWLGHIQLKAPVTVLPWSIYTSSNLTPRGILPKVIFHSQVPVSVTVPVRDCDRNSGALHQLHSARNTLPPALIRFSVAAS